jgi:hypothetical protein
VIGFCSPQKPEGGCIYIARLGIYWDNNAEKQQQQSGFTIHPLLFKDEKL